MPQSESGFWDNMIVWILKLPTACSRGHHSIDSNLTSGIINGGSHILVKNGEMYAQSDDVRGKNMFRKD